MKVHPRMVMMLALIAAVFLVIAAAPKAKKSVAKDMAKARVGKK